MIFLDFETASLCDLKEHGETVYAQHPSTKVLCGVAIIGPGEPIVFTSHKMPPELEKAVLAGEPVCCHNASFECAIWTYCLKWPAPSRWICTMAAAAACNYPQSLDGVCAALGLEAKDERGAKLIRRYCMPFKAPKKDPILRPVPPEDMQALIDYCIKDVRLTAQVASRLAPHWPVSERKVWQAHHAVNVRGVAVDFELIRAAGEMQEKVVEAAAQEAYDATGGEVKREDLTRVAFLLAYINFFHGTNLTTLASEYLERAMKKFPKDSAAYKILRARSLASRSSVAKLDKMLSYAAADGRLHGQFRYCGAGTGRWTGAGVQLQNLPRPDSSVNIEAAVAAVLAGDVTALDAACPGGDPMDGIVACVRPTIRAAPGKVLVVADYAAIEARGVLWLAGDEDHLNWFREGRDVYCSMAERIFNRKITKKDNPDERQLGKVVVLGCGYAMGATRFEDYAKSNGIDLLASGLTAEEVIRTFRSEFSSLPRLWYGLGDAAIDCVAFRRPTGYGRLKFTMAGDDLCMHLPSGRVLWYRAAELVADDKGRQNLEYTTILFGKAVRERTYGGKLVENATQAVCRDLLASALVRCPDPVVAHVHDELVTEVDAADAEGGVARLVACMTADPGWAQGFPIKAEAAYNERYCK